MDAFDIRLVEVDGEVVDGELIEAGKVVACFVCNVTAADGAATVSGLHVTGNGPNTVGIARLRAAVAWLMAQLGVDRLVLEGGRRNSGAAIGSAGTGPRTPARLLFIRKAK